MNVVCKASRGAHLDRYERAALDGAGCLAFLLGSRVVDAAETIGDGTIGAAIRCAGFGHPGQRSLRAMGVVVRPAPASVFVAVAAARAGAAALVHVSAIGADPASAAAYGRSKGEGEAAVREAFAHATILRPSIVFGREDQFVNRFAGMIAASPVVPVLRAPVRFQPIFAGDLGEAIAVAAADPGRFGGHVYELGGPDILSMGELIRFIADAVGRSPHILELPDAVGALLAKLPGAPITRDQWLMLQHDNVVGEGAEGLAALGIAATPLAAAAPEWLVRFRRQGRFGRRTVEQAL